MAAAASALCGCIGGDNEASTLTPRSVEVNLPALKTGDAWTVEESGSDYEGAVSTVEVIAADTAFEGVPAYAATLTATIAKYATARGDSVMNFRQTGILFMRRSDQETVYDSIQVNSEVRFAGDTGITHYRLNSVTRTTPQGDIPTVLRPGLAWTLAYVKSRKSSYSLNGTEDGARDTAWTETRDYTTGGVGDVAVKAGVFYAIRINWTRAETGEASAAWFSEAARTFVKEEKTAAGRLVGRYELTSLTLK